MSVYHLRLRLPSWRRWWQSLVLRRSLPHFAAERGGLAVAAALEMIGEYLVRGPMFGIELQCGSHPAQRCALLPQLKRDDSRLVPHPDIGGVPAGRLLKFAQSDREFVAHTPRLLNFLR